MTPRDTSVAWVWGYMYSTFFPYVIQHVYVQYISKFMCICRTLLCSVECFPTYPFPWTIHIRPMTYAYGSRVSCFVLLGFGSNLPIFLEVASLATGTIIFPPVATLQNMGKWIIWADDNTTTKRSTTQPWTYMYFMGNTIHHITRTMQNVGVLYVLACKQRISPIYTLCTGLWALNKLPINWPNADWYEE